MLQLHADTVTFLGEDGYLSIEAGQWRVRMVAYWLNYADSLFLCVAPLFFGFSFQPRTVHNVLYTHCALHVVIF